MKGEQKSSGKKQPEGRCESCEFFEDDGYGSSCALSLDEDEFALFAAKDTGRCPYYRFYDEYKTVQKQN